MSDKKVFYFFTSYVVAHKNGRLNLGNFTHSSDGYNTLAFLENQVAVALSLDMTQIESVTIMSNTEVTEMHMKVLQLK